jgi:hypothetical protein
MLQKAYSPKNGVCVPQRTFEGKKIREGTIPGSVVFAKNDGTYLRMEDVLTGKHDGLVGWDDGIDMLPQSLSVVIEVGGPTILHEMLMCICCAVAWL